MHFSIYVISHSSTGGSLNCEALIHVKEDFVEEIRKSNCSVVQESCKNIIIIAFPIVIYINLFLGISICFWANCLYINLFIYQLFIYLFLGIFLYCLYIKLSIVYISICFWEYVSIFCFIAYISIVFKLRYLGKEHFILYYFIPLFASIHKHFTSKINKITLSLCIAF